MREIYEKYGSVSAPRGSQMRQEPKHQPPTSQCFRSKATSGNTGTQRSSEIDQPDVLRLG